MWHPPEPTHCLVCETVGQTSYENDLRMVKHYREKTFVMKQVSSTFSAFAGAFWETLASVYSGNCSSLQLILFSGYFLLHKLWLPRKQVAWTVSSLGSPVSSLFSYLQSSLNEDTKSLACSQIRKAISYLCIPC